MADGKTEFMATGIFSARHGKEIAQRGCRADGWEDEK